MKEEGITFDNQFSMFKYKILYMFHRSKQQVFCRVVKTELFPVHAF